MFHFMAAITKAYAPMRGSVDHFAGSFVIKHMDSLILGNDRFMHKYPAKPGVAFGEKTSDKILFFIEVLIK